MFICDATADDWQTPFPEGSVDIIIYIFVLSAICPEKYELNDFLVFYIPPFPMNAVVCFYPCLYAIVPQSLNKRVDPDDELGPNDV